MIATPLSPPTAIAPDHATSARVDQTVVCRSSPAAALRADVDVDVEVDAVLLVRRAGVVVAAVEARAPDEAVLEREDPGAVPVSHATARPWIAETAADQHRMLVERPRCRRAD